MQRPSRALQWQNHQVLTWLTDLGLPALIRTKFEEHQISGRDLLDMTKEELKQDLGISALGTIKQILRGVDELRTVSASQNRSLARSCREQSPSEKQYSVVLVHGTDRRAGAQPELFWRFDPHRSRISGGCPVFEMHGGAGCLYIAVDGRWHLDLEAGADMYHPESAGGRLPDTMAADGWMVRAAGDTYVNDPRFRAEVVPVAELNEQWNTHKPSTLWMSMETEGKFGGRAVGYREYRMILGCSAGGEPVYEVLGGGECYLYNGTDGWWYYSDGPAAKDRHFDCTVGTMSHPACSPHQLDDKQWVQIEGGDDSHQQKVWKPMPGLGFAMSDIDRLECDIRLVLEENEPTRITFVRGLMLQWVRRESELYDSVCAEYVGGCALGETSAAVALAPSAELWSPDQRGDGMSEIERRSEERVRVALGNMDRSYRARLAGETPPHSRR